MAKRAANNYLTDQNWDEEEEQVEAGTFTAASVDVIQKRQIKTAKRRIANDGQSSASAFKGFSGFTSLTANKPASSAPSFNFGMTTTSDISGLSSTKSGNNNTTTTTTNTNGTSNSKYMQQLKRLNESVTQWIKDHVDSNAYCILTPIFRDYERYLADLEKTYPEKGDKQCETTTTLSDSSSFATATLPAFTTSGSGFSSSSASSGTMPTFMFGSSPSSGTSGASKALGAFSGSSVPSVLGDNKKSDAVGVFHSPTLGGSKTSSFAGFGSAGGIGKSSSVSTVPVGGFSFKADTAKAAAMQTKPSSFTFAVSGSGSDSSAPGQSSQAGNGEEEYEPPKAEVTVVKEDDAFYSKRCKLFVQRDNSWKEKGVGNLHLKPCSGKTQLLIRADTSLGNILLNIMLSSSMPMSRQGKNNVTLICVPNPPLDGSSDDNKPVSMLIKVKTGEDADELLEKLQEAKTQS
ncbi:Nuclear pore complex protein Nup50 [Lamellibrachia satsuma]|nr:Nuclear pore complex protein Nup50 [Lamellibrachia satsuma]